MEHNNDIIKLSKDVREYADKMPKIKNLVISDNLKDLINQEVDLLLKRTDKASDEITNNVMKLCKDKESYLVELDHCFKSKERIFEKVYISLTNGLNTEEAINRVEDTLRFTYIIMDINKYTETVREYLDYFTNLGYQIYEILNCWGNEYYQGLNVILDYNGIKFEVQFHTVNSFHIKEGYTREPYMVIRNPLSSKEEIDKANIVRKYYQKQVVVPEGAIDFQYIKKL